MATIKILYVEDEANLGTIVSETLEQKGFDVRLIADGNLVLQACLTFKPDIAVLDVMLPGVDGFTIGKNLRLQFPDLPIIFLTAKTQTKDVVEGFQSGGTDYMRKPFSVEELIIRIQNQLRLRNVQQVASEIIRIGKFIYHPKKLLLENGENRWQLSSREAEVLDVFSRYINRTIDRKTLLLEVWGDDSFFHSRNLDVYIRKLRDYFGSTNGVQIITLKGKGYQFVVEN
ncbi:MAG TPA: response regulator transcription factor [Chitinophagales bacterium]|nr:response regulator transcription factor [Chitinophagales bacterium]HNA57605.1 response regulator transcription factor [Chitinophagales bacterium]HNF69773.1 response regulator transcription factor [Chitinophagales bacterium]